MGNIHSCFGRRKAKKGKQSKQYEEEEAEVYTKMKKEDEVKMDLKKCRSNAGITPQRIVNRDEWIRSYQEIDFRIEFFDAIYEDIMHAALAGWDALCLRASIHQKSLQTFPIPKQRFWSIHSPEIDFTAEKIYPGDALSGFIPAKCFGDGNSLYRAISTQIFGCEDNHLEIRLRVVLELIDSWEDYLYGSKLQGMSTHTVDGLVKKVIQMSVIGQETDNENAMQDIIFQTLVPGTHASILHLYAASNATHRHVESIYPNVTNTAFNRNLLHQSIQSFTPHTDKPLHIMWTHTSNTHLTATWTPKHFVPCLDFDSEMELEID